MRELKKERGKWKKRKVRTRKNNTKARRQKSRKQRIERKGRTKIKVIGKQRRKGEVEEEEQRE